MRQENLRFVPMPEGEAASADFAVFVENVQVPVYVCRVSAAPINQVWPGYERPLEQTELASFVSFDMTGPVTVEVRSLTKRVESVEIRPQEYGMEPEVCHDSIRFEVREPCQCTVEVNGFHNALHLFANPAEDFSHLKGKPNVRYFGPGVHEPGKMVLGSNETVVIEAGAVVYGGIEATGAENVTICGHGILDTSRHPRPQLVLDKVKDAQTGGTNTTLIQSKELVNGCMRFRNVKGLHISGVICRDSNVWTITPTNCEDIRIRNVKLIGMWRYNSDGIDFCNCRRCELTDSFLRTFDDGVVFKGLPYNGKNEDGSLRMGEAPEQHILVRNCVFWCDWGRAIEIGVETYAEELTDIVVEHCQVIRCVHVAVDIQNGHRADVHDIRFEDIAFELDPVNPAPVMQSYRDEKYENHDPSFVPRLFAGYVFEWTPQPVKPRGQIRNVTVKNLRCYGPVKAPSLLYGYDETHCVDGVTFEDVSFNGVPARTAEEMALEVRRFCKNVTVR